MADQISIRLDETNVAAGSAVVATVNFRTRSTAAASIPTSIRYRVDCLTNHRQVIADTSVSAASSVLITIPGPNNGTIDDDKEFEVRQLTVIADYGLSTQAKAATTWRVRNIRTYIPGHVFNDDFRLEPYYPITAAEEAAGLDEDDFAVQYPPGDVRRYGAVDDYGNGNTDNAAALTRLAAVAAASPNATSNLTAGGFTCRLSGTRGYCTESAVAFPAGCNVIMEVPLIYTGSSNIAVFTYGEADVQSWHQTLCLDVRNNDGSPDWASEDFIGVNLINCINCDIEIKSATLFTIGLRCIGYATGATDRGFSHNRIRLGNVAGNKNPVRLTNQSDGTPGLGYCNENVFFAGNFQVYSSNDTSIDRVGVKITSEDANYVNNNQNVFYKPSFEMSTSGAGEGLAVEIVHGAGNRFINARAESNDLIMRCHNASNQNVVELGLDPTDITLLEQLDTANQNLVIDGNNIVRFHYNKLVAQLANLGGRAEGVSGTATRVKGAVFSLSSESAAKQVGGSGITFSRSTGLLTVASGASNGVGIFVDTSDVKEFMVTRDGTTGGRVGVVCYDSGGTIIHDDDLVGASTQFTETSYFGSNFYRTTADSLNPIYFRVSSDVDHVLVLVLGGSAAANLYSMSVWCQGGRNSPGAYTKFNDTDLVEETAANIAAVGNAINTTGKYAGKIVWDTTNTRMMRASGATAASAWVVLDGSASVTPA